MVEVAASSAPVAASEAAPAIAEPSAIPAARLILSSDHSTTGAVLDAISHGLGALARYQSAAARGETEPIHQRHVTARRLRASLLLLASVTHATYARSLNRDLGWMAQAAGGPRECEITLEIFRSRAAKLDPSMTAALTSIYETLSREHDVKLDELRKVLESKRYREMLSRLGNPRLRKIDPDVLLGKEAASMLRPIARAVLRAGTALDESSTPAAIHRLRVRVKRLRYALEILSGLGGKRCRRLLTRLEEIQELLGNLNDISVASAWLIGFPRREGVSPEAVMAAGAMVQSLRNRAAKLARRSVKAWHKVERSTAIADAIDEIRRFGTRTEVDEIGRQEVATMRAA